MHPYTLALSAAAAAATGYRLLVGGGLTVDTGWGRRVRALGPFSISISAPPAVVFDVISAGIKAEAERRASASARGNATTP